MVSPYLRTRNPTPAAERDAAETNRACVAEAGGKSMRADSGCKFASGQTRLCPGGSFFEVDLQILHRRKIEHDAAFRRAVTRNAVTATADRELKSMFMSQFHKP
jgi:hypothetical protein